MLPQVLGNSGLPRGRRPANAMPGSNEAECAEEKRRFAELRHTLGSLVEIQRSHMEARALGDGQVSRFEEDIRVALCAWQHARHAYLQHIFDHGCRFSENLFPHRGRGLAANLGTASSSTCRPTRHGARVEPQRGFFALPFNSICPLTPSWTFGTCPICDFASKWLRALAKLQ